MPDRDMWTARLSEFADGELPDDERVRLEAHLADCAQCRQTLDELIRVRDLAGRLPERQPDRDLWPGIAARIGAPSAGVLPLRRRWSFSLPQLAAAALLLVAAGATGTVMLTRHEASEPTRATVAAQPTATVAPAGFAANTAYDDAVRELNAILVQHRGSLDSATVRVLEESLATIDRAIARAQAALATDPNDPYLNAHLAETMRRKVSLMRRAAALVAAS
jgi:anti-sigma factor RsiW